MKLHNHVFTTLHIISTTTFLFFFRSEAKRYAGADVKQRKKKGWPFLKNMKIKRGRLNRVFHPRISLAAEYHTDFAEHLHSRFFYTKHNNYLFGKNEKKQNKDNCTTNTENEHHAKYPLIQYALPPLHLHSSNIVVLLEVIVFIPVAMQKTLLQYCLALARVHTALIWCLFVCLFVSRLALSVSDGKKHRML